MWEAGVLIQDCRTQTSADGETRHQGGSSPAVLFCRGKAGPVSSSGCSQAGLRMEGWAGLTSQGNRKTDMGEEQAVETPGCCVPRCLGQARVEDLRGRTRALTWSAGVLQGPGQWRQQQLILFSSLQFPHLILQKTWVVRWYLPALRENRGSERRGDVVCGHPAGKHRSQGENRSSDNRLQVLSPSLPSRIRCK